MKKFATLLFLTLIPLSSWAIDFLPKEKSTPVLPNPYSLSFNWWDYYDVDAKTLKSRKEATEAYYAKLEAALPQEEAYEAEPYFDRILKGLDILIEVKSIEAPATEPTIPKKETQYSFGEWIALSTKMLHEREELQYLNLRLNLALSGYKSGSREVDSRFKSYVKQEQTAPGRLIDGLNIIQGRIVVAIEKAQVNHLEGLVVKQQAIISSLETQIENSTDKIDFSKASLEEVQSDIQKAKARVQEAHTAYVSLYESNPTAEITDTKQESELADEKLLNAKIEYEISRIELVNLEIQNLILGWSESKEDFSRKKHKQQIQKWKTVVDEIQNEVSNSEDSSELILQQSLKSLALQDNAYAQDFSSSQSLELAETAILKIEQLKNSLYVNSFLMTQLDEVRKQFHYNPLDWLLAAWDGFIGFFSTGKWFQQSVFKIGEYPVTVWALIKFFIIIAVAVILGNLTRFYIHKFGRQQRRIKMGSIYILSRISHYFIVIMGIVIAGYAIGLDLTIFAYVAGALAIWVGFSLQSIFHNFISGIIVLISKVIRMNDVIELDSGEIGTVVDLNLRTTVIRTYDGKDTIIPNADIVNKKFKNLTLSSHTLRIQVPFRVGLSADKKKIAKIVIEAAKKVEITSEVTEPEIWITGYGENYINMDLVVWINALLRGKTASRKSQYFWAIDDAFRENGIEIPAPLQNIRVFQEEEEKEYPIGAAEPVPVKPKNETPPESF